MRGLTNAVQTDLNPDFRERFVESVEQNAQPLLLKDEAECAADATAMAHRRRGAVLAARVGGPFVNIDRFLALVLREHRDAMLKRSKVVHAMLKRYDESGDGMLQRDEFGSMLAELSPKLGSSAVERMWQTCGGCGHHGSIDAIALEACLFEYEWKAAEMLKATNEAKAQQRAAAKLRGRRVGAQHAEAQEAPPPPPQGLLVNKEMVTIAQLWDSVKDGAERVDKIDDLLGSWHTIVRLQAWARGAQARAMLRAGWGRVS